MMAEAIAIPANTEGFLPQFIRRWAERLSRINDLLNPILVKEVRQAVRGREFNYSFWLSLGAAVIIAMAGGMSPAENAGAGVFGALMMCLSVVALGVIPLGAFFALSNERIEKTFDLVEISIMSHRAIILGKLFAQVVKLLIYFAAMAPFMAMSFLLGGIDLITILASLTGLFLAAILACMASLFLSTLARTRAMMFLLLGLAGVFALQFVPIVLLGMGGMFFASRSGFIGIPWTRLFGSSDAWLGLGVGLTFWAIGVMNLVLLAENRIAPPTENRTTPLRIGFFVQLVAILGWITGIGFKEGDLRSAEIVYVLVTATAFHFAAIAVFAVTEDLVLSRRSLHEITGGRRWLKFFPMLWPGGGYGALYVLIQMALVLAIPFLWWFLQPFAPGGTGSYRSNGYFVEGWGRLLAMCGYVCFFTGVPALVCRLLGADRIRTYIVRVCIFFFFVICEVVPTVASLLVNRGSLSKDYAWDRVLNPIWTIIEWDDALRSPLIVAVGALGVIGVGSYVSMMFLQSKTTRGAIKKLAEKPFAGAPPPVITSSGADR